MDKQIDELVARIAQELKTGASAPQAAQAPATVSPAAAVPGDTASRHTFTREDYPLLDKHPELVHTPTGKNVSAVTMEAMRRGELQPEDLRISRDMLLNQAQVAESAGKPQIAQNLRRAAELTAVPDEQVIHMYDLLRPNRATRAQLQEMAERLKTAFHAPLCAALVMEAADIYEKRGVLLHDTP